MRTVILLSVLTLGEWFTGTKLPEGTQSFNGVFFVLFLVMDIAELYLKAIKD